MNPSDRPPTPPSAALRPLKWPQRLPTHVINGITVAVGIALVHVLVRTLADPHAAQLAVSGAIFASLADVPDTPGRSWRQVLIAGILGCSAALVIALLKPFTLMLGAGVMVVVFVAMLTLAWGPRAAPISFAPVLAVVFTMGIPEIPEPLHLAGWHALGIGVYMLWSFAVTVQLQPRYRSLALAAVLGTAARLLRSRADMLDGDSGDGADSRSLQGWVRDEAALAERLQFARNFLFAGPDTPRVRRETAALLYAIDLRDILLASSLDLELLGDGAPVCQIRAALALKLREMAESLDASQALLRGGTATPPSACGDCTVEGIFGQADLAADDPRARLLPALVNRLKHLGNSVDRIGALLLGGEENLPLSRTELRQFVISQEWPFSALRSHVSIASPVFRHAVRAALALGCAYYLALALPWTSHPQWLVLGVAVVLRGNLQQTLARRNARILGTLLGCLIVLLLAHVASPDALMLVFLMAAGVAHSFVVERYLITAAAATVMALLQVHLVAPTSGFPIAERVVDTMLGALLAWAFCYVLPFWERRSLPQTVAGVLLALRDYARHALRTDSDSDCAVAQRLARRRAYDALGALAATLERAAFEPASVRPPERKLAVLLDHGLRLMAHLSVVRLILTHRKDELNRLEATAVIDAAKASLDASLTPDGPSDAGRSQQSDAPGYEMLPAEPPSRDVLPWLAWRLRIAEHDGREVGSAARSALAPRSLGTK